MFAILDDLFGALERGHFFQGLLNPRCHQAFKGVSIVVLENLDHRVLGNSVQQAQVDPDLLEVGGVAFGQLFGGLLSHRDWNDFSDEGGLHSEALRFEGRRNLAKSHFNSAVSGFDHERSGGRHDEDAEEQESDSDDARNALVTHVRYGLTVAEEWERGNQALRSLQTEFI